MKTDATQEIRDLKRDILTNANKILRRLFGQNRRTDVNNRHRFAQRIYIPIVDLVVTRWRHWTSTSNENDKTVFWLFLFGCAYDYILLYFILPQPLKQYRQHVLRYVTKYVKIHANVSFVA